MARKPTATERGILNAVPEFLEQLSELNNSRKYDTQASGTELYGSFSLASRPVKPFIIGFIPPDVPIEFVPIERNQQALASITDAPTPAAASSGTSSAPALSSAGAKASTSLPDSFYRKLATTAQNMGASPSDLLLVLYSESGLNPAAANHVDGDPNKPIQAKGLNQITPVAIPASGMTKDFWKNDYDALSAEEQLPYVEKYFKSMYSGPYTNPDQIYVVNFAPAYVKKAQDRNAVLYPKFNSDGSISNNWKQNQSLNPNGDITVGNLTAPMYRNANSSGFKSHLARLEAVIGNESAHKQSAPTGASTSAPSVAASKAQNNGATSETDASPTASRQVMIGGNITDIESDDPLRQTGRNIRVSDTRVEIVRQQVDELRRQIQAVQNIPPLLMLINPSQFNRSYEHTIDRPKARGGHIVHQWLEKPLVISSSGQSAAQYVLDASGSGGLTHTNRLHSLSYKNMMSLVLAYKNNGNLFTGDSVDSMAAAGNVGIPVISMSMFIYYDGHIYIGSFDDMSVTDAAEKPFSLSYSWKFTARYDIDVSSITDTIINRVLAGSARAGSI